MCPPESNTLQLLKRKYYQTYYIPVHHWLNRRFNIKEMDKNSKDYSTVTTAMYVSQADSGSNAKRSKGLFVDSRE